MLDKPDDTDGDAAQDALRASLERAHELVSEAKQRICLQEEPESQSPNPDR